MVDLRISGSSLGTISKYLKVLRSPVQIIIRKEEQTLARKVQINLRTTAKDLGMMLEETGRQVSISTVKQPLLQSRHEKARLQFVMEHGALWQNGLTPCCLILFTIT
uniref:Transposase Tc1-like domain-containing protein n=1 Tax=Erpetoichthys calabaricus TaxID=27687 RepID=A0A8C4X3N0_ERPCA